MPPSLAGRVVLASLLASFCIQFVNSNDHEPVQILYPQYGASIAPNEIDDAMVWIGWCNSSDSEGQPPPDLELTLSVSDEVLFGPLIVEDTCVEMAIPLPVDLLPGRFEFVLEVKSREQGRTWRRTTEFHVLQQTSICVLTSSSALRAWSEDIITSATRIPRVMCGDAGLRSTSDAHADTFSALCSFDRVGPSLHILLKACASLVFVVQDWQDVIQGNERDEMDMAATCPDLPLLNITPTFPTASSLETSLTFRLFMHFNNAFAFSAFKEQKIAVHIRDVRANPKAELLRWMNFLGVSTTKDAGAIPEPTCEDRNLSRVETEILQQVQLGHPKDLVSLLGFTASDGAEAGAKDTETAKDADLGSMMSVQEQVIEGSFCGRLRKALGTGSEHDREVYYLFTAGQFLSLAAAAVRAATLVGEKRVVVVCKTAEEQARFVAWQRQTVFPSSSPSTSSFSPPHFEAQASRTRTRAPRILVLALEEIGVTWRGLFLTRQKVLLHLLECGEDVVHLDSDVTLLTDLAPHFRDAYDMEFGRGTFPAQLTRQRWGFSVTAGFNRIRATRGSIRMVELLLSRMLTERQLRMQRGTTKDEFHGEDDQWAWNALLLDLGCEFQTHTTALGDDETWCTVRVGDHKLSIRSLPPLEFPVGGRGRLAELAASGVIPVLLHPTGILSSFVCKMVWTLRHRAFYFPTRSQPDEAGTRDLVDHAGARDPQARTSPSAESEDSDHGGSPGRGGVCLLSFPRSGSHWVRFMIEFMTKLPTAGSLGSEQDAPLCTNTYSDGSNPLNVTDCSKPYKFVAFKFHHAHHLPLPALPLGSDLSAHARRTGSESGLRGLGWCSALIFIMRDFRECIPKHLGTPRLSGESARYQEEYLANVEGYVRFHGKKLLLPYQGLVDAPASSAKTIADFLSEQVDPARVAEFVANVGELAHKSLWKAEGRAWFKPLSSRYDWLEGAPSFARRQFMMMWRARLACFPPEVRALADTTWTPPDVHPNREPAQGESKQGEARSRKEGMVTGEKSSWRGEEDWLWDIPLPTPPVDAEQEVYYVCTGHCGGLADRLTGMLNVYLLAVITNRSYRVLWTDPGNITEWLIPTGIYPWAASGFPAFDAMLDWMGSCVPNLASTDFTKAYPHRRLGIRTNVELFTSLQQNPLYAASLRSWDVNVWFANFFRTLFQPSRRVLTLAAPVLHAMQARATVCLQARMLGNRWPQESAPQTQEEECGNCEEEAPDLESLWTTVRSLNFSQQLLVASDCEELAQSAQLFFHGRVLSVDGPIAHVDKRFLNTESDDGFVQGVDRAVAEFYAFRHCQSFVFSRSGFGELGAATMPIRPHRKIWFWVNGQALRIHPGLFALYKNSCQEHAHIHGHNLQMSPRCSAEYL